MLQMTGRVTVSSHGADRMKCGTIVEFNLKRGRASPIHFEHHVARVWVQPCGDSEGALGGQQSKTLVSEATERAEASRQGAREARSPPGAKAPPGDSIGGTGRAARTRGSGGTTGIIGIRGARPLRGVTSRPQPTRPNNRDVLAVKGPGSPCSSKSLRGCN